MASAAEPGAQPDCLHFGTVYDGRTVEASIMVLELGNDEKLKLDVSAPKFVKVVSTKKHVQKYQDDYVCATIMLTLDTSAVGDFKGEIIVTLGKSTRKVPTSVSVKERHPGLVRLLVLGTPFNCYSTRNGSQYQAWTNLVDTAHLDATYLSVDKGKPVFRDLDLNRFDTVLIGPEALTTWTKEDAQQTLKYAERGGRVVVAANYFFRTSVAGANMVLEKHSLAMLDTEANGPSEVMATKEQIKPEVTNEGIKSLRFFRASPIEVRDSSKGKVLVKAVGIGAITDGFVAHTKAEKGHILAIGQSLWWHWITPDQAKATDNARLMQMLLTYPGRNVGQ
jgi:hypothetical protein